MKKQNKSLAYLDKLNEMCVVEEIQCQLAPIVRMYSWYLFAKAIKLIKVDHKPKGKKMKSTPKTTKGKAKVKKVMKEFKAGELRSGSKKGPKVKSRKQAVAIALSEARKGRK